MVNVDVQCVFPASKNEIWRLLQAHLDDNAIGEIHPFVISSKRASSDEGVRVFDRVWRVSGRTFSVTTKYDTVTSDTFRSEITASTGGLAPGSYIENHYSDAGEEKTKIESRGELTLLGVPGVLQGWVVRRSLNQSDVQDLRYILKTRMRKGLQPPRDV